MSPDLRDAIAALGTDLSLPMMQGTQALFAERHLGFDPEVQVTEDVRYGDDPRNRMDLFRKPGVEGAPILVYLHGGGFVQGDKRSPVGLPFYQNVGDFAARNGMLGVTVTYRLAPGHQWPSGPEDLAAVVRGLRANAAQHGGDPTRIYLAGQSAGAVHVASYVAHLQFHAEPGGGIAGAILLSCVYDVATAHANQFHKAYYGEDSASYAACSTTHGLIATDVPLLMTVSEHDVADFQKQAAAMVAAWGAAKGTYPPMLRLTGHNHLSPGLSLGSSEDGVGREILEFIAAHGA
ncbi:alpha/beta hydrolase [Sphingomonas baiyangensis]|uniref:Alpha/beta hydrolase n=1 Tax=Sphingomonas baiyangensis TaxID=2572576 RepID=A0A4U1L1D1_9SPHN|nr:alpha/beta hydrolase [Sphingomonas baiyangensis]TKD50647.1 alpha/beta hydrolase [Sphingomonas baiyangensis]